MSFSVFLVLFSSAFTVLGSSLACLNDEGEEVDWYFVYKQNNGLNYAYFANGDSVGLKLDSNNLGSNSTSCIKNTLTQVYNSQTSINYIAYNDESPDGTTHSTYGHTKGVFAFDNINNFNSGFWLVHSVPHYPDFTDYNSYTWGNASETYAQSFLCITMTSIDYINITSNQLLYHKPFVYSYNQVNSDDYFFQFNYIINKQWLSGQSTKTIKTSKSFPMIHFTRSGDQNLDIMENIISPYYDLDFVWETWRRNPVEDSYCPPQYQYMELNVDNVQWADGTAFKETQDHGKLGISYNNNTNFIVCVGGLNRMTSQNSRGGGYVCFEHTNLWTSLNDSFVTIEYCS